MKTSVSMKGWMLALSLALTLSLTACLNNDDMDYPDAAVVTIYHGSPDAPGLDIFAESRKINNNPLAYGESFPYSNFYTGNRTLKFSLRNALNTVLETEQTLEKDKVYTIFLVNPASEIEALKVEDKWSEPTGEHAQVRLAHLSPDAGDIEVFINGEELPFGESNAYLDITDFEKIDRGQVSVAVRSKSSGEELVSVNQIDIRGNRVYTLVVRGFTESESGSNPISLQLLTNYIRF